MQQTFTQEDFIRFLYKETSPEESWELEQLLAEDWSANESYQELKEAMTCLPKVTFNPSDRSIERILQKSRQPVVEASS